jgi:phytoene dehydrogenase-like protein
MQTYDTIIIGAGMSGLAAGIRLAMFDKKVLILEKHTIAGGLNSFYARKGRKLDVGLHAMTNFAKKGERGKPLTKLLKQLRIPYGDLALNEQHASRIIFPHNELTFTNDLNVFTDEVLEKFPSEKDGFMALLEDIRNFNEVNLENPYESAKERVAKFIKLDTLREMIFCPLLIYGSAWEDDMDFSQFVIMFKSIFLEGFARPEGGVRRVISLLMKRYKDLGGEIRFRSGVDKIITLDNEIQGVALENGEVLTASKVLSSIGYPETVSSLETKIDIEPKVGKLSFTESILCFSKKPNDYGVTDTIVFYNENQKYNYRKPTTLFDDKSAVVCLPNNFEVDDYEDGMIRLTFMANFDLWNELTEDQYKLEKEKVLEASKNIIKKLYPAIDEEPVFVDIFTPTTIRKFTGHHGGTVYGSTDKSRDGRTPIDGLYIIGTDQGFLGIVGAMLSGISMANLHCLMEGNN